MARPGTQYTPQPVLLHSETLFDNPVTFPIQSKHKIELSFLGTRCEVRDETFLMILSVAVISLSGCVHERVIYRERIPNPSDEISTQEPPEVIQERIAVAPSPVHVWIGGHWGWQHGAYAWAPGYWAVRPHYRSHWAPGAWSRHGHGWRWHHGRWH